MEFREYDTLTFAVKEQIKKVKGIWLKHLGNDVTGIYIHGSIALKCFREGASDIDLLIITNRRILRKERLAIVQDILEADKTPSPLEMSAVWIEDLRPWKYPTPCQFHYSEYWTERYRQMLNGTITNNSIIDQDFCDEDIACHAKLTAQSGICIYGKPVEEVFPDVPEEDFLESICSDIDEYDFHAYDTRYFASNVLTLGRILSYKIEKRILSKYEGGLWTRDFLPDKYKYIVDLAIKEWYLNERNQDVKQEDLNEMKKLLIDEIKNRY